MTIGAALLTFFAPFLALVVALVMRGGETRPTRRSFLHSWAIASGVWLATGWLIGLIIVVSIAGGGGCKGGIDKFGGPPTYRSIGASGRWTATYPCREGGTTTTPVAEPFADLP